MAAKRIFLIAGEESGDQLGGPLMQELKHVFGDTVEFSGIGGTQMIAQGLQPLFQMMDLSIMGLFEVLKHLPRLIKRFNQTVDVILAQNPDILITIDAPDFGLRVARKIKKLRPEIKLIHYVAPTVWAWRPGRARKIAEYLDGLLCLFPFEPPYFEVHGLKAQFVGHPIAKNIPEFMQEEKDAFCNQQSLDPSKPILCVLPGSRVREVESLKQALLETIAKLKKDVNDLQVIIPTLPHLLPYLKEFAPYAYIFVPKDNQEKYLAFAASTAALHASGTVALELALSGTPMVTLYKMNAVSAWIGKRIIKTPYANLVNILLRHPVVPELLQEKATAAEIVPMVQALLTNETIRNMQAGQLQKIRSMLAESELNSAGNFILYI